MAITSHRYVVPPHRRLSPLAPYGKTPHNKISQLTHVLPLFPHRLTHRVIQTTPFHTLDSYQLSQYQGSKSTQKRGRAPREDKHRVNDVTEPKSFKTIGNVRYPSGTIRIAAAGRFVQITLLGVAPASSSDPIRGRKTNEEARGDSGGNLLPLDNTGIPRWRK